MAADVGEHLRGLSPEDLGEMEVTMKMPPEERRVRHLGQLMDLVAGLKFFQNLSFKLQQQVCRQLRPSRLALGDAVMTQGEEGYEFYVLLQGEVDVFIDGTKIVTLQEGASFGAPFRSARRPLAMQVSAAPCTAFFCGMVPV